MNKNEENKFNKENKINDGKPENNNSNNNKAGNKNKNNNKNRNKNGRNRNKNGNGGKPKPVNNDGTPKPGIKDDKPDFNKKEGRNDSSWSGGDSQLVKDTCSFPWNRATGLPMPSYNSEMNVNMAFQAAPGIMTFNWIPCIGVSKDAFSGVNIATKKMYTFIRHNNSGSSNNIDAPDYMMYFMAIGECYAYVNELRRIYGIARNYQIYNRYTPKAILTALDVDYEDVIANFAQFRAGINILGRKLKWFAVPNIMDVMKRHSWMNSNLYKDDDNDKAQLYLYKCLGYHFYAEGDNAANSPNYLDFTPISEFIPKNGATGLPVRARTVEDLIYYGTQMIDALQQSQDINIMSGDVQKAYADSQLMTISDMPDDYLVEAIKNDEVLTQFNNWKDIGLDPQKAVTDFVSQWNITQDPTTNAILFNPKWALPVDTPYNVADKILLNMYTENPTAELTMVATRGTAACERVTEGMITTNQLTACGTFVPISFNIHSNAVLPNGTLQLRSYVLNTYHINNAGNVTDTLTLVGLLESFDWHPEFNIINSLGELLVSRHFDLDNYTIVTADNIQKMDDVAILYEFGIAE